MVNYLRVVGSMPQQILDKKKNYRHYSCMESGNSVNHLEVEIPCPEGTPQMEVECPLSLDESCRTWLIWTIIYVV